MFEHMRPPPVVACAIGVLAAAGAAQASFTNNIMITGYWPPTNAMIRPFSTNPAKNPSGWVGGNWEGRGYNIHSFFPEFPGITSPPYGPGQGEFMVDYQNASTDFWTKVNELRPIAIITFSRGDNAASWELEGRARKLPLNQWTPDYIAPTQPTPNLPIASEPDFNIRYSSLPMLQIRDAVNAAAVGVNSFIDMSNAYGGTFVSEFTSYHSCWYQNLNSQAFSENWCVAGGHIHVGGGVGVNAGKLATEISLRTLINYVDSIVPAPGAGSLFLGTLVLAARRRR